MARYIDADIVLPKIQYRERTYGCSKKIYSKVVKDAPTADVRPERHGKWEKSCDGYSYFCSICKEEPDRSGRLLSDFCPWCGAKMDGKDDE